MNGRMSFCFVILAMMFFNSLIAMPTADEALSRYYFDGIFDDYFDGGKLF